jgi:uncharacterized protein YndB with AHSA1/START domain
MSFDLSIERAIDAPPEVVFDAFFDPEAQRELYDDTREPTWSVQSELDLRVGGTWTITFGKAGEEPYRETNVFSAVDRPHRVAFESTMIMGDGGPTIGTAVVVTFEVRDGKTLLTITQTGFERETDRDDLQGGWPSILDALERVVAARAADRGGR